METAKIHAIKVVVEGKSWNSTKEGTKQTYCDYFLPFMGTMDQAKAAAIGLGEGCAAKGRQFYGEGRVFVMADTDVLIDKEF